MVRLWQSNTLFDALRKREKSLFSLSYKLVQIHTYAKTAGLVTSCALFWLSQRVCIINASQEPYQEVSALVRWHRRWLPTEWARRRAWKTRSRRHGGLTQRSVQTAGPTTGRSAPTYHPLLAYLDQRWSQWNLQHVFNRLVLQCHTHFCLDIYALYFKMFIVIARILYVCLYRVFSLLL